jgi:UTP--glucose-1-phosphate uridylyltransferase
MQAFNHGGQMARIRKIVIPVAGLGTRMLPATKSIPKEMLPVIDKPVIQYAVEEAYAAGIDQIILVTGRGKAALENHFDIDHELEAALAAKNKDSELEALRRALPAAGTVIATRQQQALGLGHAVWCARHLVGDEPFAVTLPDVVTDPDAPCLKDLVTAHEKLGGNAVTLKEVPRDQVHRYGIAAVGETRNGAVEVTDMVEKPTPDKAPSNLHILGRYILQPQIFDELARQERGAAGEIQLTDAMKKLIGAQPFHGVIYEGDFYDCGDRVGYLKANLALALKRPDIGADVRAMAAMLLK